VVKKLTSPIRPRLAGLTIEAAASAERPLLENLTQLYLHDFSALYADTNRLDLGSDGLFQPDPPLDRWWTEPDHLPLLLRWHGKPAGFALINRHSHMGAPIDHGVAEFFVVRKYRRLGLGAAAAHAVFGHLPGRWEAAVMRSNAKAQMFWEAAIRNCPKASAITAHDRADGEWNGCIFGFSIAP
jgi:predicted acetyltransferase